MGGAIDGLAAQMDTMHKPLIFAAMDTAVGEQENTNK